MKQIVVEHESTVNQTAKRQFPNRRQRRGTRERMRLLSHTFRCHKSPISNPKPSSSSSTKDPSAATLSFESQLKPKPWCVYLIISSNSPFKTYVGVTLNFSRRLKQHNGEIKGGAKATRAGRPWVCACMIHGFKDQSQACEFESKWKEVSRKIAHKRKKDDEEEQADEQKLRLLKNRQRALEKVKFMFDCSRFEFDGQLDPF
ncbi:structure-specific endonuclease subunit SLX1 [Momordica charantia]|uniref:Structure-specific endonuclease subunit SLX1 n=1 Tax=Momordica charantia TaxID=3673 RepID=A0A6J1DGL6_MOMCH|nr:structure-specific endonuclease subunit SLX1 [Momordica charantia]